MNELFQENKVDVKQTGHAHTAHQTKRNVILISKQTVRSKFKQARSTSYSFYIYVE